VGDTIAKCLSAYCHDIRESVGDRQPTARVCRQRQKCQLAQRHKWARRHSHDEGLAIFQCRRRFRPPGPWRPGQPAGHVPGRLGTSYAALPSDCAGGRVGQNCIAIRCCAGRSCRPRTKPWPLFKAAVVLPACLMCACRLIADRLPVQRAAEFGRLPVSRPGPARVPLPSRGQQPKPVCMHASGHRPPWYATALQEVRRP
jgi:hypothetical protein